MKPESQPDFLHYTWDKSLDTIFTVPYSQAEIKLFEQAAATFGLKFKYIDPLAACLHKALGHAVVPISYAMMEEMSNA